MPNESVKTKTSAAEKITAILNKLGIGEAIEAWRDSGDALHKRIDEGKKTLDEHKKKLEEK